MVPHFVSQINKADRATVLFRIQHTSRGPKKVDPSELPYDKLPVEALLPEQRDLVWELTPKHLRESTVVKQHAAGERASPS